MKKEYIYIRTHRDWVTDGVCKLGRTECIPDRESTYITGEFVTGIMVMVIEVPQNKSKIIEKCLHYYFEKHHVQGSGGVEFYKKELIEIIITWFEKTTIQYKALSQTEISELIRKTREFNKKQLRSFKNFQKLFRRKKAAIKQIIMRKYQQECLMKMVQYYKKYDIGKLIWACGLGKTIQSLLFVKKQNYKSVVIGVPSTILQKQWKNEILKMFPNKKNILFVGGEGTTNAEEIKSFIKKSSDNCKFIITTYHSCHLLANNKFDFKIGDEAHHLVGIQKEDKKIFTRFHGISSSKTLFMTATEKVCDSDNTVYSMDDKETFGYCIDEKSVKWAIEERYITDYNILTIKNTEEQVDEIIKSLNIDGEINRELFISAYMTLKSIEKYPNLSHVLIYTNEIANAELVQQYIDTILKSTLFPLKKDDFYNKALHSKDDRNFDDEIGKFKKARYGIIPCVYMFGEGFDEPKLNGVCIAENMKSKIRIVQYILRANRLDKDNPDKISHVIIPYIDIDDWDAPEPSFEKVRNVIKQLRNVDENISQKIHSLTNKTSKKKQEAEDNRKEDNSYILDEEHELHKLKLRLRKAGALASRKSEEQQEYEEIKARIKEYEIKRSEYGQLRDDHPPLHLPKDPKTYFRTKYVWTNWYDFLGVDTKNFIQSKQEWIKFCKDKKVSIFEDYEDLCKECDKLPPHPGDFYDDFTNVEDELGYKGQRRH